MRLPSPAHRMASRARLSLGIENLKSLCIAAMVSSIYASLIISPSMVLNRDPSLLTFMIQPFSWLMR